MCARPEATRRINSRSGYTYRGRRFRIGRMSVPYRILKALSSFPRCSGMTFLPRMKGLQVGSSRTSRERTIRYRVIFLLKMEKLRGSGSSRRLPERAVCRRRMGLGVGGAENGGRWLAWSVCLWWSRSRAGGSRSAPWRRLRSTAVARCVSHDAGRRPGGLGGDVCV